MGSNTIEIRCSQCSCAHGAEPRKTFLGFRKLTCPACGHVDLHPLTSGYRGFYWFVLVVMVLSLLGLLAHGQVGVPGLISLAAAYALVKDRGLRKKATVAASAG